MSELKQSDQQISLVNLVAGLWHERVLVAGCVFVCALVGLTYALFATPVYKAEVVMTPVGQRSASSALGQLGGLAALAGVNLGSSSTAEPLAVLRSREFAEAFIREMQIEKVLVEDYADVSKRRDIRDAVRLFLLDIRVVAEDKKAGTVSLMIFWKDPVVAAEWANAFAEKLNSKLRHQALEEAERNVKFLRQEIASTDIVSMQQSLGRILEAEMQKYMLAKGADEFAFKIVDRAMPPKLRESPRRTLIVMFSLVGGAILALLLVIFKRGLIQLPRRTR